MLNKMIEICISMMILIPVFWVLNKMRFHSTKKALRYFLFAAYLSAVYLFVGMPTLQFMRFDFSVTLIPLLPMVQDFKNTVLNIFLFVPLGIMLPFLWEEYRDLKATMMFGFRLSLAIELLQIFTYRSTDINDIIANTLGAVLGYFVFRTTSRKFPTVTKFSEKKDEISILFLAVFFAMFFVQPYLANLYYKMT